jgi:hypothetical protein
VKVTEDQVLFFRAQRQHMVGPGADSPMGAARGILGAQAQAVGTGLLAIAQRTKSRPTAATLQRLFEGKRRRLVRVWGQRGTMHIYDRSDWRDVIAAFQLWAPNQRRGPMPTDRTLDEALSFITEQTSATRRDILHLVPKSYLRKVEKAHAKYLKTRDEALKFAAGRILYGLCLRGDLCVGDKIGSQQAYAARTAWYPKLPWPDRAAEDAAVALTRRYLAVNGPATVKDVAYHFGARQREAKAWLAALRSDTRNVSCGDRKGLVILADDAEALAAKPPKKWPVRLMPQWDTYLMSHADKTWTVPDEDDRKVVWRGSAVVAAAILHRGRVIGEWNHDVKTDRLEVRVIPLSGWAKKHLPAVKREAKVVAAHLGLDKATVST